MFSQKIIGQERIARLFEEAFRNGRLSHAYLFVGQSGVGKEAVALALAEQLLSGSAGQDGHSDSRIRTLTHPDVHLIFPSQAKLTDDDRARVIESIVEDPYQRLQPWGNPSISINRIREMRRQAAFKSFEGRGRVFILYDCERMTIEASNAVLKILEEPPPDMYLIMTSARPNMLLSTITSRCQAVNFGPLTTSEIETALLSRGVPPDNARLAARLSEGSFRRALDCLDQEMSEIQKLSLSFFRQSIHNEFRQLLFVHEVLDLLQRDGRAVKDLLTHLLLWVRDALLYREAGNCLDLLIHVQEVEILENFTKHFPGANLQAAAKEIERALELMERNVQLNLILIVLLNKLRTYLKA